MTGKEIAKALRRNLVETGSLMCLGCGYEHGCSVHGCRIMREAAELIELSAGKDAAAIAAAKYTSTLPARICLQRSLELQQLERLQRCYALHMAMRDGTRLPWLEKAIDQQQDKVRMLTELRSAERPGDCSRNHGLGCTNPENVGCLWSRSTF